MKKEHFLQSEGFKTVAASVLSILIGLAVGSIVILIVGLTSPNSRSPRRGTASASCSVACSPRDATPPVR